MYISLREFSWAAAQTFQETRRRRAASLGHKVVFFLLALRSGIIRHLIVCIRAVEGHFDHPYERPWMYVADFIHPLFAEIAGKPRWTGMCQKSLKAFHPENT